MKVKKYIGKFRVIVNEPIIGATSKKNAEALADLMAQHIYKEHPEFEYVELASVEEKEVDETPNPFGFTAPLQ